MSVEKTCRWGGGPVQPWVFRFGRIQGGAAKGQKFKDSTFRPWVYGIADIPLLADLSELHVHVPQSMHL